MLRRLGVRACRPVVIGLRLIRPSHLYRLIGVEPSDVLRPDGQLLGSLNAPLYLLEPPFCLRELLLDVLARLVYPGLSLGAGAFFGRFDLTLLDLPAKKLCCLYSFIPFAVRLTRLLPALGHSLFGSVRPREFEPAHGLLGAGWGIAQLGFPTRRRPLLYPFPLLGAWSLVEAPDSFEDSASAFH